MAFCPAAEVQTEQVVPPLEIRAASWSLLAMTSTRTGGTLASCLIFSSLVDVSCPLKLSRFFSEHPTEVWPTETE